MDCNDEPEIRKVYLVMFCKQSNKKRKSYEDGIVVLKKRMLTLYSTEGKVLSTSKCKRGEAESFEVGSSMGFYGKEVEIMDERPYELFERGTIFISPSSPSPPPPTKRPLKAVQKAFRSVKPKSTGPSTATNNRIATPSSGLVLMEANAKQGTRATTVDPFLAAKLRPHQVEGVKFLFYSVTGYGADFVST